MKPLEPQDGTIVVSEDWLKGAIETREQAGDYKAAAIYAFVLANLAYKDKDERIAKHYSEKCLDLIEKYPTNTLEQCASPSVSINGVLIPGLFHRGTAHRALVGII